MKKKLNTKTKCPKCSSKVVVPIVEEDLGTTKSVKCPKCKCDFPVAISASLACMFESEPTLVEGKMPDVSLFITTIENEDTEYQAFELMGDHYVVGRLKEASSVKPDIAVVTNDMRMSGKHAIITKKGNGGYTLMDAGSKNGVCLNDSKLDIDDEIYLEDGDVFSLGRTGFEVSFIEKE